MSDETTQMNSSSYSSTTTTTESAPTTNPVPRPRRSSIADLFVRRPSDDFKNNAPQSARAPGQNAMAQAMAQSAQPDRSRRMSITTLGLSGSPTHAPKTPFGTLRDRGQSMTDKRPGENSDESAIEEVDDNVGPIGGGSAGRSGSPTLGRRLSLGAKAYGDNMRASASGRPLNLTDDARGSDLAGGGTLGEGGQRSASGGNSPPTAKKEGFNWSDTFRSRAQRTSLSAAAGQNPGAALGTNFLPLNQGQAQHQRNKSSSESNPMPASAPLPQQPKSPPPKAPDHFQERILKGDFYMD